MFTTTYNPKANGQTERYNRALAAALRAYVSGNQTGCDSYIPTVTFAYNMQVYTTTGIRPFDLVLSRDITFLTIEPPSQPDAAEPREMRKRWSNKIQSLMLEHRLSVQKAQARYKHNFDRRLRKQVYHVEAGSYVFIRQNYRALPTGKRKTSQKLAPKSDGPYFVEKVFPTAAAVQVDDRVECVN